MIKARSLLFMFVVFGLSLIPDSAKADQIAPGGSGTPDVFSLGYSYLPPTGQPVRTVLATQFTAWPPGSGSFTGQFYEQVESDPGNVFCSGCVDFIFQVLNNSSSTSTITRITESGFLNYQTDVGYDGLSVGGGVLCGPDDNGFCDSGSSSTIPSSVDRSADGDVVGFNLPGVLPTDSTVDLVIETNATSFADPLLTIYGSNSAQASFGVLGPSGPPVGTAMPEPSTGLLLAIGLSGFLGLRKIAKRSGASSQNESEPPGTLP